MVTGSVDRHERTPPTDVIGHSAGGVVARLWIAAYGAGLVRRMVTLGAHLHGTEIAAAGGVLAPDASVAGYNSTLLNGVATQLPLP